jgi:predicted dehydrogenase
MIKAAIIGLGKMGISHCAVLGAHPDVDLVAVCDSGSLLQDVFKKLTQTQVYSDYKK